MNILSDRIFKYALGLTSFLFLSFYLILSYHNRFADDDLLFLAQLVDEGWLGTIKINYSYWSFRWSGLITFLSWFSLSDTFSNFRYYIFVYHIASITLLISSAFFLIKVTFRKLSSHSVPRSILLSYAVVFCASLYFITFQAMEVWHWVTVSFFYVVPLALCLLGTAFIIRERQHFIDYIVLIVCFAYIGGGVENFALLLLCLLGITLAILLYIHQFDVKKIISNTLFKKLFVASIALAMSTTFTVTAPGVSNRMAFHDSEYMGHYAQKFSEDVDVHISNIVLLEATHFVYRIGHRKHIAFVLLVSLWVFFGFYFRKHGIKKGTVFDTFSVQKLVILSIALFLTVSLITFLPLVYVSGDLGPERSWMPISLCIQILSVFWFFYLGYKINSLSMYIRSLMILLFLGSILILSLYISRQYPVVSAYSKAYDIRIALMDSENQNGRNNTLVLEPLPSPGMLMSGEISPEVSGRFNRYWERILKLNYEIKVRAVSEK